MAPRITGQIVAKFFHEWTPALSRFICISVIIYQACIFDYYLVAFSTWHMVKPPSNNETFGPQPAVIVFETDLSKIAWVVADLTVIAVFIYTFIAAYKDWEDKRRNPVRPSPAEPAAVVLLLGWVAWLIYSIINSAKIYILFTRTAQVLIEKNFWGPNMLKTNVGISCIVHLSLVMTHHNTPKKSPHQASIDFLTSTITMDILDTTDFLEVLFIQRSHIFLTFQMHHTIMFIACMNLVLPTVPLLALSSTRCGRGRVQGKVKVGFKILYQFLVNLPFLTIRMMLWHLHDQNISAFLVKNILGLAAIVKDLQHDFKVLAENDQDAEHHNVEMDVLDAPTASVKPEPPIIPTTEL